jgi:hypothetical protein
VATKEELKLEISVSWGEDLYPFTDYIGTWSSKPHKTLPYIDCMERKLYVDGVVKADVKEELKSQSDYRFSSYCRNNSRYWIAPDNGYDEVEYLLQDYVRCVTLEEGLWHYEGCTAMISLFDIELGQDSIWGVESDAGESHRKQIEADCISKAKAEAEKLLRKLCELTTEEVDHLFMEDKNEEDRPDSKERN